MTAPSGAGAPSIRNASWSATDWHKARKEVFRLQVRIAKAVREKRFGKAKALQWLLTHSWSAKLLAVRKVTTNKGKNTPGVDGVLWKGSKAKLSAARSLRRHGYRPQPLRRIFIPKSPGKLRPLGIPAMYCRAMQALYGLALEPVAEVLADWNSYGFRQRRSTADAIGHLFIILSKRSSPGWLLDADIKACFDRISHDWLLGNIPMDRAILRSWLKAGYIDRHVFYHSEAGTPQGGIISPILANMALDGLEAVLHRVVRRRGRKVNIVRYADDFVITGCSREYLELTVLPAVVAFLAKRGLTLSPEKTRFVHIDEGFDFLGCNIRKYNGKLLIKPAKEKVLAFVRKIREFVKSQVGLQTTVMLRRLNAKLRGWGYYYRHVVAKETFEFVDQAVYHALQWWMRRRHPNKTPAWRRKRYFRHQDGRRWLFFGTCKPRDGRKKLVDLFKLSDLPIRRHVKVRGEAHPYDPRFNAYLNRRWTYHLWRRRVDRRFFAGLAVLTTV